jgi:small conductance mechanosensitive channel
MNIFGKVPFFILLSVLCLEPKLSYSATPTPAPEVPILNDNRTAAELPTKTKIPTDEPVEIKRKESDHQIQDRLIHIAQSQDIFKQIKVSVIEGIVTLKGSVEEDAYAKSFSGLSEKVQGVIGVVDMLTITDVQKTGIRLAQSEVDDIIHKFFKFLPYLASCIVILILTIGLGVLTARFWHIILARKLTSRPLLVPHLTKIFTAPVYIIGFYLILQIGGAAGLASTLIGGTGVIGIILGLAGKNILENVLSSFMITLRNPFKVGDEVVIGDQSGIIYGFDSRCTMVLSYDGIFTQIPNTTVLAAVIKNLTSHPVNRVVFDINVSREIGFAQFKAYFEKAMKLNEKSILADPKPKVLLTLLKRKSATVKCKFWVDTRKADPD